MVLYRATNATRTKSLPPQLSDSSDSAERPDPRGREVPNTLASVSSQLSSLYKGRDPAIGLIWCGKYQTAKERRYLT
jgi:hypothetical protein